MTGWALALLTPVSLAQAAWVRRTHPRLHAANAPWGGSLSGPDPLSLLVVGDSAAAGVGVDSQDDALPGNIARELKHRFGRGTEWRVVAEPTVDTNDLLVRHLPEIVEAPADLIFLTVGSSDAIKLRGMTAFGRDLSALLSALRLSSPHALILVSQLPRFDQLRQLAEPLRSTLVRSTAILDRELLRIVAGLPGVIAVITPPVYATIARAADGLHPNATGYRDWIDHAFAELPDELLAPLAITGGE